MKWGVSLGLVGGGRALSAVRLESSCAGPVMASDEVQGRRLPASVYASRWRTKASRHLTTAPPTSGCKFSYSTVGSGTHSVSVLGPDLPGQGTRKEFFSAGESACLGKPDSSASMGSAALSVRPGKPGNACRVPAQLIFKEFK